MWTHGSIEEGVHVISALERIAIPQRVSRDGDALAGSFTSTAAGVVTASIVIDVLIGTIGRSKPSRRVNASSAISFPVISSVRISRPLMAGRRGVTGSVPAADVVEAPLSTHDGESVAVGVILRHCSGRRFPTLQRLRRFMMILVFPTDGQITRKPDPSVVGVGRLDNSPI